MAYQKNNKLVTGISFQPNVLAYVDALAKEDERSRSDYINRLIKEDAKRRGVDIASFPAQSSSDQNPNSKQAA